ncbi:translation initiation factor IF-3 [Lyngbya confervoides]|uniref:Translation initiation factor IF-3 n=1 Tax=Lyngbya confervoides BDU141951 TaxID=1574623 RepID=A0ABD4T050_9CYAN|nr:translation initiation factor IF-3 [Lyngbya confervoides]MCM1981914.1 translation initiation factor IF-3 [Lyngbya confervoides BDU141951]
MMKKAEPAHPINHNIRAADVLLIDQDNTNQGVIPTSDALKQAQAVQLDLVVVSPEAQPPVARIMDYGKHLYQQKKRLNSGKSSKTRLKEVKLRPNVDDADYSRRVDLAKKWLGDGNMVKFQVRLRGREHQHRDRAVELLSRIQDDLENIGKVQSLDRRGLVLQMVSA